MDISYMTGMIVAFVLLAYLFYVIIKPEKF